jgi:endo-1,4-beta-D-glucanase Y
VVAKAKALGACLVRQWCSLVLSALPLMCTPALAITVPAPASASAPQTQTQTQTQAPAKVQAPARTGSQAQVQSQPQAQALSQTTATVAAAWAVCPVEDWPLWRDFLKFFVTSDGRVIYSFAPKADSVSEGQSYAMFFALIANDPVNFEKIWRWTVRNMFANDLDTRLPAWLWGQAEDGSWKVLDAHSASDSDTWIAYLLLEAGRVWQRPDYIAEGNKVLATIEKYLILDLPSFGKMLSSGRVSFVEPDDLWRLNPSYLPIPLLRRFADLRPEGPWTEIALNTPRLLKATSPKGFAADWVSYVRPPEGRANFGVDELGGDRGSYDAIRVYLWAGMTDKDDPLAAEVLKTIPGMLAYIRANRQPPENVLVTTGTVTGQPPFGFSAAVLPYLKTLGATQLFEEQSQRARSMQVASASDRKMYPVRPPYYDYALSLFAFGWTEGRYQFLKNGQAKFHWEKSCSYAVAR